MSIKIEIEKMEANKRKEKRKEIGTGLIKVEVKDGEIEATSRLDMPGRTLILTFMVLELMQRNIVEKDPKMIRLVKNIRDLPNKELLKLINDNSDMIKRS